MSSALPPVPRDPHTGFPPGAAARFAWVYAAEFVPFAVVVPYLQVCLKQNGFSRPNIGLLVGLLGLTGVIVPPVWGFVSDTLRRPRSVLAAAVICAGPAFVLLTFCQTLGLAVLGIIAYGFFNRPILPLNDGLTLEYIHRNGGDYGRVRAVGSLAFVVTVIVMELLGVADLEPVRWLLIAGVLIGRVHHVLSLTALPPIVPPGHSGRYAPDLRVLMQRGFVLLTLVAFLGRVAMMSYYGFFTLFLKDQLGFKHAGLVWAVGPFCEIPMIFFSAWLMKRIGMRGLFALGLAGTVVRLLGFSLVTDLWQVWPLQLLHALTFGAFFTAGVAYVSRLVPAEMKSSAQTLYIAMGSGLGALVGATLAGWVAEELDYSWMYGLSACVAAMGLGVLYFVPRAPAERTAAS